MEQPVALRPGEVPLQWHEAAAIAQLVADGVSDGRLTQVPPVEWLVLDGEGALHVLEPPGVAALPGREPSADVLRSLFQELVGPNSVPAALPPALESGHDGKPIDSAAAFSEAIRFFVRPSREKDLQALASRLRVREEASRLQNELEELTRKARLPHQPAKDDQPAPPPPTPSAGTIRKRLVAVAACGALLPIVLVLRGSIGSDPQGSVGGVLISQGKQFVQDVRDGARTLLGTAPDAANEKPVPTASAVAASRGSRRRAPIQAPVAVDASVRQMPAASLAWILSEPIAPAPALMEEAPPTAHSDAEHVYGPRDEEVTPASLVRPRLPARPATARHFGALEVIIAASGQVERVQLLATTAERRYYDAMLLPAVKAWVFTPARRHGVPVRYRLEIPLTH